MRLTLPEPKIRIGEDGFDGIDKLGRAPLAHQLTDLVDRIDDPITIALDGGWGSGKSFFLKLWIGEHSNPPIGRPKGKARMIYFDAFEHDFLDDPLVGLVGAIAEDEETTTKSGSSINSLKKWAWKLAKPVARAGLFAITSGVSEVVGAVGDAVIKVASEEAEQTLEQFWAKEDDKRAAMKGFRAALTALTTPDETGTPTQKIVLIIDELDRCRPDYALSMLLWPSTPGKKKREWMQK